MTRPDPTHEHLGFLQVVLFICSVSVCLLQALKQPPTVILLHLLVFRRLGFASAMVFPKTSSPLQSSPMGCVPLVLCGQGPLVLSGRWKPVWVLGSVQPEGRRRLGGRGISTLGSGNLSLPLVSVCSFFSVS
ncbi:hypothetical protein Salat_2512600 [Sesamum alatum]|uniref:Uncharacterized protein n=1 Tax=Sesamum alatum TaxID=300844 RepID=A0AAE2CCB6_9LAMI|nr:hypothetical protein Salat_2512600 [Sesamum alatum]